jgi:spore maturation protein CgeB
MIGVARQATLAIVGNSGGTNIGGSLHRASIAVDEFVSFFDAKDAWKGPRLLKTVAWRLMDRRPLRLDAFSRHVVDGCAQTRPRILISTGIAPLTESALVALRRLGITCVNYSTDDPWNQNHRAEWHLRALRHYDVVFTPRRSNIADFRDLGCTDVRYLPFAYDDELFSPVAPTAALPSHDVLFVGGADRDRADFMAKFMHSGLRPALVGDYWSRFPETRGFDLGQKDSVALRALTVTAAVNLCLVRHANRDGNVMRSFEIPAVGGFMLAEDTSEHREIFGEEGKCVIYFKDPETAAERARWALANPEARQRMAGAAHALIAGGGHTYRDRLLEMLAAANEGRRTI